MRRRFIGMFGGAIILASFLQAETIAIKNATVFTMSKGKVENGIVVIRDGKITAVGHELAIPTGATVVDATGMFLTPGLIDCHSHTAIEGNVNEGSVSDSAMADIKDVIDPYDINIYRALAGGLTVSNVLHGSANAIGGADRGNQTALGQERARNGFPRGRSRH
jgi:imidazolonepropionase-like amidohydrolase